MINEATVDGEDKVLARIFGVRCSLHGASLLIGDILRRCFASAVESSGRIFRMIANHEALYQALKEAGAPALLGVAETRMASQLYSTALILKDKVYIQRILLSQRAINFYMTATNLIKKEFDEVKSLVFTESTWNEFSVLTSVLHPILGFLRYCDGNNPSLSDSALAYASAEISSLRAADEAAATFPDLYAAIPFEISEKFNKRRVDCVDVLAKAASMVNPKQRYRCIICTSRLKHVIINLISNFKNSFQVQ